MSHNILKMIPSINILQARANSRQLYESVVLDQRNQRKAINFFLEVCKNIDKYAIRSSKTSIELSPSHNNMFAKPMSARGVPLLADPSF